MAIPSPSTSSVRSLDSRVDIALNIVDWDALSSLACKIHQVDSSHWGDKISGSYNLVRFLHLHDDQNTTLVARVPLRPEDGTTPKDDHYISKRIESEVATMQYVERHTNVPVPHVYSHSTRAEGDIRSAYILMSKVEGVRLFSVWNDMADDKRRIILQQVVDILLELWSHRFSKLGGLFKRDSGGEGKDAWYIDDLPGEADPRITGSRNEISPISYAHAADYWLAYVNAYLEDIRCADFGSDAKSYFYSHMWFIRSTIPSLFDPSIDNHGYPLTPGDFHSQNIIITDIDTHPRITAVIDWERSVSTFPTSFAQYPFFIVDHPSWEKDNPLCERNKKDQTTFNELILEAERLHKFQAAVDGPKLSHLISNSYGVYLFGQIVSFPIMCEELYPALFAHIFGEDKDFHGDYMFALTYNGILRETWEQFEKENAVWLEAREVLGDDMVRADLNVGEFKDLVSKHLGRFTDGGLVREWLTSENSS